MNWNRVLALVQRNIIITYRGIDPLIDVFYWPAFDIILWGFTSMWIATSQNLPVSLTWLAGLVIWQAYVRVNFDVSLNLLIELWSRNIVNLFASPIEITEWIAAAMILGLFDALIAVLYGSILVALLYKVNIFTIGWLFIPLLLLLMLSGWAIGLFAAGSIIRYGQKVQKVVWVLGWFFAPFSAIFFPLSAMPLWAQAIGKAMPMSYVFEGLRVYVAQGHFPLYNLGMGLLLSCVYLCLALLFFIKMFNLSRYQGLARLEAE